MNAALIYQTPIAPLNIHAGNARRPLAPGSHMGDGTPPPDSQLQKYRQKEKCSTSAVTLSPQPRFVPPGTKRSCQGQSFDRGRSLHSDRRRPHTQYLSGPSQPPHVPLFVRPQRRDLCLDYSMAELQRALQVVASRRCTLADEIQGLAARLSDFTTARGAGVACLSRGVRTPRVSPGNDGSSGGHSSGVGNGLARHWSALGPRGRRANSDTPTRATSISTEGPTPCAKAGPPPRIKFNADLQTVAVPACHPRRADVRALFVKHSQAEGLPTPEFPAQHADTVLTKHLTKDKHRQIKAKAHQEERQERRQSPCLPESHIGITGSNTPTACAQLVRTHSAQRTLLGRHATVSVGRAAREMNEVPTGLEYGSRTSRPGLPACLLGVSSVKLQGCQGEWPVALKWHDKVKPEMYPRAYPSINSPGPPRSTKVNGISKEQEGKHVGLSTAEELLPSLLRFTRTSSANSALNARVHQSVIHRSTPLVAEPIENATHPSGTRTRSGNWRNSRSSNRMSQHVRCSEDTGSPQCTIEVKEQAERNSLNAPAHGIPVGQPSEFIAPSSASPVLAGDLYRGGLQSLVYLHHSDWEESASPLRASIYSRSGVRCGCRKGMSRPIHRRSHQPSQQPRVRRLASFLAESGEFGWRSGQGFCGLSDC
eukprot:GHVT01044510.1.p1 GENE.GHVT01044510.1~~GHVT01044510.1.p1  ORF type:complete len:652 (-),score=51.19 GHVT01044510.1:1827-3782(-)